ncbi:hypothetical protein DFH09DRAFT_1162649 [Mycena vulgaris]|nr:hypothetical protein DFH09DRAFT_1162649 [Mycena vulgaris]
MTVFTPTTTTTGFLPPHLPQCPPDDYTYATVVHLIPSLNPLLSLVHGHSPQFKPAPRTTHPPTPRLSQCLWSRLPWSPPSPAFPSTANARLYLLALPTLVPPYPLLASAHSLPTIQSEDTPPCARIGEQPIPRSAEYPFCRLPHTDSLPACGH